jgi:Ser/Thr protein kinase RdoA (MazF antagonist)
VSAATTPPATVIAAFGLEPESVTPLAGGLINASFRARRAGGEAVVLQRVNPIFPAVVNDDIDAVTRHLGARGLSTPQLLRTQTGHSCLVAADGVWRLLSYIAGATHQALADASQAHEAGRVLGGFHAALADFDTPLGNRRPPVHELARHLGHLQQTLKRQTGHRQHAAVTALATEIFALADAIGPLPAMPDRLVHGDPKISNIIFAGDRAVCLVDLDTIGRFPAPLELGDALRSWCNIAAEDSPDAAFSLDWCRAAIAGYRAGAGALLGRDEWLAVPKATQTIAVELAARFAADALNERYFGWDRQRFARSGEHQHARALAQLRLAYSIGAALPALDAIVVTQV